MKIIALSDLHGYLPEIKDRVDVIIIPGDIVDLYYQGSVNKSISWFSRYFVPWAMDLPCEKVIIIGGNHDFFFQRIVENKFKGSNIGIDDPSEYRNYIESESAWVIKEELLLPRKIEYLQDTSITFGGKRFYGTPWCPELHRWAFFKSSDDLKKVFNRIPDDVDVLITHSPGKYVNDTGVSLQRYDKPEYGSQELTDAVLEKKPKWWFVGHVHSGNHNVTDFHGTKVVNVSIKDEGYDAIYGYQIYEI
jgi:Icc-related predicted phosphoesterase